MLALNAFRKKHNIMQKILSPIKSDSIFKITYFSCFFLKAQVLQNGFQIQRMARLHSKLRKIAAPCLNHAPHYRIQKRVFLQSQIIMKEALEGHPEITSSCTNDYDDGQSICVTRLGSPSSEKLKEVSSALII